MIHNLNQSPHIDFRMEEVMAFSWGLLAHPDTERSVPVIPYLGDSYLELTCTDKVSL
jgi:hypothetical protein